MIAVVTDAECVTFLQWALPRLNRRWEGYRKVRRRVCKLIWRRAEELGLTSLADYRCHLEANPQEWQRLDALTDVTISRFYRDRAVFDFLRSDVLPALAERAHDAGSSVVRAWSAGCANGEEPYTLSILWNQAVAPTTHPSVEIEILATDIKPTVLRRASNARYPNSSLRDLPAAWREAAFSTSDGSEQVLDPGFRRCVTFTQHDIRSAPPPGPFDLVMCRYQAFTYFDDAGQEAASRTFAQVTRAGAALVLGNRESLPSGGTGFSAWPPGRLGVYRRLSDEAPAAGQQVN